MNKLTRTAISSGLLLLLIAPIVAIFFLSRAEVRQYRAESVPVLNQKSYGEILSVERMDIEETITVSGTFVSTKKSFMELPKLTDSDDLRLLVDAGDEIIQGQVIGYIGNTKNEIKATASGIVVNANLGSASYLTLQSTEDVALDARLDDETLAIVQREGIALTTQDGEPVTIVSTSKQKDEDGKTSVLLSIPGGVYGQVATNVQLNTGRVFPQALVIDARCLFQLNGDTKQWYVRTVDQAGNYLEDVAVQVSYKSDGYVAITGIPEGTFCDSGYQRIAQENK